LSDQDHPTLPPPAEQNRQASPLRGSRVLVVDDDPEGREMVAAVVLLAGAEVRTAPGGLEALELLHSRWPTLLVSDLAMPAGDGYELIHGVRLLRGGVLPAVAMSGSAAREDRERTRSAGFNAHLAKPVDVDELILVLARLALTSRRPEH
jgi:two-component system CheB/CheR fusion protein